jgi:hypothetical protein
VQLLYLDLLGNEIGPMGGFALGKSLAKGYNVSLLTLKLDYNTSLSNEGVINLCRGLCTNATLKQLHLEYCNISVFGAAAVSALLSNSNTGLEVSRRCFIKAGFICCY